MEEIQVNLGERSYPILVGAGLAENLPDRVRSILAGASGIVLLTHPKLARLYGRSFLKNFGRKIEKVEIPDGERFKTLSTVQKVYTALLQKKIDRSGFLLTLGGGVVGDVGGFVAATYLRGIAYAQVPTSLIAQVDAAIGGKSGVNFQGKNLVGAFYQPRFVLSDPTFLKTLPDRHFRSGLAEVIKYGVIGDPGLFDFLEKNVGKILAHDPEALVFLITRSGRAKAEIVAKDERETTGLRMLLNFGHTFGHSIEKMTGYGQWLHGEAVARGMLIAAELSAARGFCTMETVTRLQKLLGIYGLLSKPFLLKRRRLLAPILLDKKMRSGKIRFVFMKKIGEAVVTPVTPEELL